LISLLQLRVTEPCQVGYIRPNQRKLSWCCQHCTKELHAIARQRERKSQSPFSITRRTNVDWRCLTQCVECRQMPTKAGCRRWPLAVFFNILDIASINAWTLFRKTTSSRMSRRQFLRQLSTELTEASSRRQAANYSMCIIVFNNGSSWKRRSCQVKSVCKHNRTTTLCDVCKRPACGKCMANVCKQCHE